jgi:hypothetical protein
MTDVPDEPVAARQEVVLTTWPAAQPTPAAARTLFDVVASTVGLATQAATTIAVVVEHSVGRAVSAPVNAALDRMVPVIATAIVERIDLTDLVVRQVDLGAVVTRALDDLDLTAIVIDRVDIDAVVAKADMEAIIDRVPVIDLANYVVDEIDLPQIIRDSTSGIAGDVMNGTRRQALGADRLVSGLADRIVFRRRGRKLDAPGDPQSLGGRFREDMGGDPYVGTPVAEEPARPTDPMP